MSGPVKNWKISPKSKYFIFACPDLSKIWKFHRNKHFGSSHVWNCQKLGNFAEIKILESCPDLSKIGKIHRNQTSAFSHVWTCQQLGNFFEIKVLDFHMTGSFKIFEIPPKSKFWILTCWDLSYIWILYQKQNFGFSQVLTCQIS